jgi:hypothetical protein
MRASIWVVIAIGTGCHEDGGQKRVREVPTVIAEEPSPPTVEVPSPKIDLGLAPGVEMRRPIRDGRLALIPIVATREIAATPFVTLADGMDRRDVVVYEVGYDWIVHTVRVSNRAREPLLVLGGELILDGMQDRAFANDLVVAPGETVSAAVRCVEENREHGDLRFASGHAMAELSLRRTIRHHSQRAVWNMVESINDALGLHHVTKTYRHAAKRQLAGPAAARRAAIVAQLAELEERERIVGLAVAIDDHVVAVDRFATPEIYRALEPILLASYLPGTDGTEQATDEIVPADVRDLATSSTNTLASFVALRAPSN